MQKFYWTTSCQPDYQDSTRHAKDVTDRVSEAQYFNNYEAMKPYQNRSSVSCIHNSSTNISGVHPSIKNEDSKHDIGLKSEYHCSGMTNTIHTNNSEKIKNREKAVINSNEQVNINISRDHVNIDHSSKLKNIKKRSEQLLLNKILEQVTINNRSEQVSINHSSEPVKNVMIDPSSKQENIKNSRGHIHIDNILELGTINQKSNQVNMKNSSEQMCINNFREQVTINHSSEEVNINNSSEPGKNDKSRDQGTINHNSKRVNINHKSKRVNNNNSSETVKIDIGTINPNSEQVNISQNISPFHNDNVNSLEMYNIHNIVQLKNYHSSMKNKSIHDQVNKNSKREETQMHNNSSVLLSINDRPKQENTVDRAVAGQRVVLRLGVLQSDAKCETEYKHISRDMTGEEIYSTPSIPPVRLRQADNMTGDRWQQKNKTWNQITLSQAQYQMEDGQGMNKGKRESITNTDIFKHNYENVYDNTNHIDTTTEELQNCNIMPKDQCNLSNSKSQVGDRRTPRSQKKGKAPQPLNRSKSCDKGGVGATVMDNLWKLSDRLTVSLGAGNSSSSSKYQLDPSPPPSSARCSYVPSPPPPTPTPSLFQSVAARAIPCVEIKVTPRYESYLLITIFSPPACPEVEEYHQPTALLIRVSNLTKIFRR